ncbi:RimK family alpha-L-glutamate ligase [Candidatus Bathyarchaeota archaeon]|nr:MAG: RimK family alpha-L-glutamate ligase [Candidatus Bathyarchaeota archaeon]
MRVGILGRNIDNWGTSQLRTSLNRYSTSSSFLSFSKLAASISCQRSLGTHNLDLTTQFSALIIRPIGIGSLEEIIFRMDLLHHAKRQGILVVNSPEAIEKCVDKYRALSILEESGFTVPRTIVTENTKEAIEGFHELGGDIITKPLFGSRGVGSTRISDPEIAARIFRSLRFQHNVLYLQEFIPHDNMDIRAFVVGSNVIAAMRRLGDSWKTNVSQGAKPASAELSEELENLAIDAAKCLGCEISGVDILESSNGPVILELNSQPGWRGLQSVTKVNIADCIVRHILAEIRR